MLDENLNLIVDNLFVPVEQRKKLKPNQEKMLLEVLDCYNLQLQKPMLSKQQLRDYIVDKYGCSLYHAYKIIQYAAVALGNVQASHKNWVRQRIEYLMEKAYSAAVAKDYKQVDALTKIATTLSKAFQTNLDEGEIINAQKYLEIDQINITVDPSVLGLKHSDAKQKQIELLLRKYEIEDAEVVTPTENKDE